MRLYVGVVLAAIVPGIGGGPARAGDNRVNDVLEKAVKALGGEEKLGKVVALTWSCRGFVKVQGRVSEIDMAVTFSGLDRLRREFRAGSPHRLTILDGDRGWHLFRNRFLAMSRDDVAVEKHSLYVQLIPSLIVPLRSRAFTCEAAGEEDIGEKGATILKITGPDGKAFTLSFDKQTGLPVKQVSRSLGADGKEQVEVTTFTNYKDFGGIKKATSIEVRSDSQNLSFIEITDFKVLNSVDPATFAGPG